MKNLLLTLLLLLTLYTHASTKEAILQLDTKGHTALIRDIIVTKSGDIISASNDKTIRVWSSKTGKEKRKILGQIGAGNKGQIFAMALSPNEEFLAVGGFINNGNGEIIRIYNYPTGRLIKVLKSHKDVVLDLSFSQDGKYLISGSSDTTAKIWEVDGFRLKDTLSFHTDYVYAVKIIQKNGNYFAITAGYDNKIALYNMQTKKTKHFRANYKLKYLATSKEHIAVCGFGREILIFDTNLNLLKKIKSETVPTGLAYSPTGEFLIAGTGGHPLNVNIYSKTQNYKKISSFKKHTNSTIAVNFLDNQTAISAGGDNFEMYIWSITNGRVLKKIEGVGEVVWSVGIKGDTIAWGNHSNYRNHLNRGELQKTLNLKTMEIKNINLDKFNRILTTYKDYSLIHTRGGDYGYSDATLLIKKGGRTIGRITRDATNGYHHRFYGFYKNYIISGGSHGFLKIYNLEGREIANLVGHTGEVWSIALNGDRLVSGSDDQTIRVWDLSQLKPQMRPQLNIFVSKDNEWVVWTPSGYYNASVEGAKYVGYHINQGAEKEAYFVSSDKYPQLYRPDIVQAVLKTGDEAEAIKLVSKTKRVKRVDVVSATPPMLSLLTPSTVTTKKSSIKIRFAIESKSPISKFIVMRNGEKITTRTIQRKFDPTITVDLEEGENIIAIRAKNQYAISDEVIVRATKIGDTQNISNLYKPTLYLLSIGVSQYQNSDYNLKVADQDAQAVAEMFKAQEGKIYKKVEVKKLINQEATTDALLDGLDWIDKEVTQKDIAIIFVAGHGENDEKGNYYFLSHDANVEKLRRTALRWLEIKDTIENLPSKVILLADTCHSGNITGTRRRGDITGAIKSIIETGTGAIVMTATTGRGYSEERESWGHGAFTKALLEGINNSKADFDNDGTVTIKEIDLYITQRVKRLTNGRQKPTTKIPDSIPDFAVGVR